MQNTVKAALMSGVVCMALGCSKVENYDVVIVGGSTSGTAAAIQAARSGAKVLLLEEYQWLGGMLTAAGVSATDGCYNLRGGLWAEFRDSLEARYGGPEALKTGWVSNVLFSPAVGNEIFRNIASREKNLEILFGHVPGMIEKTGSGWIVEALPASSSYSSEVSGPVRVAARILVDATELGDVAKAVGIPYRIGMDSRYETGEECAPEEANGIVQDMTYVMTLKDFGHPVPIPEPDGYTRDEFACCCLNELCPQSSYDWTPAWMMKYGKISGDRYMINWPLHGNDFYSNIIDMDRPQRDSVLDVARQKSIRFLYFLQNELGFETLGLAEDEYPTADRMPFYPYYRESRRIKGKVTFTVNDILDPYGQDDRLYRTCVAVGDYPVDQHHNEYVGIDPLPELHFPMIPSYGLPLGVMIPERCEDFLVIEKSISVTNVVNGTTRLQPVVLQMGQAAGILAAMASAEGCTPSEVSVRKVQQSLLDAGAYLLPLLDAAPGSDVFESYQKVASTGILKYYGRHQDWANQSWLDADREMDKDELLSGLREFYGDAVSDDVSSIFNEMNPEGEYADPEYVSALCASLSGRPSDVVLSESISILEDVFGRKCDKASILTRGECAVLIDRILDPFGSFDVTLDGDICPQ